VKSSRGRRDAGQTTDGISMRKVHLEPSVQMD